MSMNQTITDEQKRLSRKYVAYETLTNLFFVGAVWLYFYRIFITDYQVGILDGFAFAIGLVAEVPSGALADRFGRDKMVKLGQILAGGGLLIQAFGSSFVPFFVGQAIMMIGISFVSGADEALFFQKLNFNRTSVHWRKLVTRGSQAALIGALFATVVGGWLHTINPRIPWILTGVAFISSVFLIWSLKDVQLEKTKQKLTTELRQYLVSIKDGFAQFGTPKLWLYVPIIITVQGLFYTAGWGLLRIVLLDRFHFDPFWGSVVVASSSLITVGILAYMHKHAENLSEKRIIALISLGAAASLLLSLADIGVWGYAVILMLYAGEHILYPFMSEV
ncbi:MAG: MFS transporter, partial [Pseudomonadales bacterium]|nr:MFS transporter [Pseudomonadales bacterium]